MVAVSIVIPRFASLTPNIDILPLEHMPCTDYLVWFQKDQAKIQILIEIKSKVNVMIYIYASKLTLKI